MALCCSWAVPAQGDRLTRVLAAGEIRICIWPDYYGISFRNPKTQQLSGIDIDVARALARDLRVAARFVDSSFAHIVQDLNADRCDIAMFAIGITPQRQQHLWFTRPYLISDIYAVTTKSNRLVRVWEDIDKPGVVVAVAKGTLHEPVMTARLRQATLLVTPAPQGREQEVESGRADVFMSDFPFSRRMLETTDWARVIKPSHPFHLTPYAYAMQPGDEVWRTRVQAFLDGFRTSGELWKAARRHKLESIVVDR